MDNNGRRKFLGICLGGMVATATAAMSYSVLRYLSPLADKKSANKVVIPEKEIAEGNAKFFPFAGSSAVIVRKGNGELVALSAICTHLGCIIQWQNDTQEFLCPCHAGRFTADGAVISGPPPKPLSRLPVTLANGNITVG